MALFSSVCRHPFEPLAHFLCRKESTSERAPQRAQECAAQGLAPVEKPPECEAFDCTANDRKRRKRHRKVTEKYPLGGREEEREVKISKGGSPKYEAEITQRGHAHQKKREMHSLEKKMEGESEFREAGEKKRKVGKQKERKITEPTPLLVVVKPLHTTVRSSFLKPIEEELPMLQVNPPELLAVPSCSNEVVSLQRSSSQRLLLAITPSPTPAPDEVVALQRPPSRKPLPFASSLFEPPSHTPAADEVIALQRPPSRKPLPFVSSPFESPHQLMLVDIEDEENEYVEYTGNTIRPSDLLKSEHPQMPEVEMKPRKMVAWLEKDCEVQEEAWASEVVEVQGFEEEEGDNSEIGHAKAIQGHLDDASQTDEPVMKLFCVASSDGPKNETQHNVNVQKKCKRKKPLVLFTWAAEKAKKNEEKKIIKEKERREKQLLLERYMNDPKLKHLRINKHNRNYSSS